MFRGRIEDKEMIRGTTPTYEFETDISLVDALEIFVTFKQGNIRVEKTKEDCQVEADKITLELTQTETLNFRAGGYKAQCQIRAKFAGAPEDVAVASNIMDVNILPILKEGVI